MASARTGGRNRGQRRAGTRRSSRVQASWKLRDLPYSRRNVIFLAAGLLTIVIGYICMAQPPVNGFLTLSLSPVLVVLGYCVLIPIGLLLGAPSGESAPPEKKEENTNASPE